MKKKLHINNEHLSSILEVFGQDFSYDNNVPSDNNITTNRLGFTQPTSDDISTQSGNTNTRQALYQQATQKLALREEVDIDFNNINTIANEPYNQLDILRHYNSIISDINKLDKIIYSDIILILLNNLFQNINFENVNKTKLEEIKAYL